MEDAQGVEQGPAGGGNTLFVVVATGQGVANLPPILEIARPGDRVLWLESAEARRAGWRLGPEAVLAARQIRSLDPVALPDEPAAIVQAVRDSGLLQTKDDLVFVHNGGTKLMSAALEAAASKRPHAVVYGMDRPAELWLFPDGVDGELIRRPYRRARLTLEDILRCSGHSILRPGSEPRKDGSPQAEPVRFWPGPVALDAETYGFDQVETERAHHLSAERSAASKAAQRTALRHRDAKRLLPDEMLRWEEEARLLPPVAKPGRIENLFNAALRIAEDAAVQARAQPVEQGGLGHRFERAVVRRVQAWLDAHCDEVAVLEAWHSVRVGDSRGKERAEWDIVLVLASGVLISLECKSFDWALKDLDARLLNLQRAGTRLARMALCVPLYTDLCDRPWFAETLAKSRRIAEIVPDWIAFTLPDQSPSFPLEGADGGLAWQDCPPFEERLGALLRQYGTAG